MSTNKMKLLIALSVPLLGSCFVPMKSALPVVKTRPPVQKMKVAQFAFEAQRMFLALPSLYCLMSVNEYVTHRYYQVFISVCVTVFGLWERSITTTLFHICFFKHAEYNKDAFFQALARTFNLPKRIRGGGHVEHHAETYDDMQLKTDDPQWAKSPAAQTLNEVLPICIFSIRFVFSSISIP